MILKSATSGLGFGTSLSAGMLLASLTTCLRTPQGLLRLPANVLPPPTSGNIVIPMNSKARVAFALATLVGLTPNLLSTKLLTAHMPGNLFAAVPPAGAAILVRILCHFNGN